MQGHSGTSAQADAREADCLLRQLDAAVSIVRVCHEYMVRIDQSQSGYKALQQATEPRAIPGRNPAGAANAPGDQAPAVEVEVDIQDIMSSTPADISQGDGVLHNLLRYGVRV